jgi:uncharacterized protein DUF6946
MSHLFFDQHERELWQPEDVKWLLAEPEKQWVKKYSACETACSWFDSQGLPKSIQMILETDPVFRNATLEKAYFERQTKLDSEGRPSQTDVLALVRINTGVGVIGIEGKVNESFGELIKEWNDYSPGKLRRLAGLIEKLKLRHSIAVGDLRYQLLHRTVATLIEAERANAHEAAMVVQSFSPDDIRTGFDDFRKFASAFGAPINEPGMLSMPVELGSTRIRLGWTINSFRPGA